MRAITRGTSDALPGEVEVVSRLPGGFDLYRFCRVMEIQVRFGDSGTELFLRLGDESKHVLSMVAGGVGQLCLPEFGAFPPSFPELEIRDIRERGLEGIRFSLEDFSGSGFRCLCREVRLVALDVDRDGKCELQWSE